MVKPESWSEALQIFDVTDIQLADDGDNLAHKSGQRHLGAAVGSADFVAEYLNAKVEAWAEQVDRLTNIVATQTYSRLTSTTPFSYTESAGNVGQTSFGTSHVEVSGLARAPSTHVRCSYLWI